MITDETDIKVRTRRERLYKQLVRLGLRPREAEARAIVADRRLGGRGGAA